MKIPIDQEYIEQVLMYVSNWTEESILDHKYYRSPCKRFTLQEEELTNLCGNYGYTLHIDNSDMQSIAHCEIESQNQLHTLMDLYKDY